jgi:hypothetical protein
MTACNMNAAVISFEPNYDHSKIEFIKHQQTTTIDNVTETVEEQVPKLSKEPTPYNILKCLNTFYYVCTSLSCTMFQKFPLHLKGHHSYHLWEQIIDGITKTVSQFNKFKAELLESINYKEHMDYLREIKKSGSMEPRKFVLKL